MSHASLALAVALGSLPVCLVLRAPVQPPFTIPAPYGEPNLGDCRPDIGPGGIIQVHPLTANPNLYKATMVTTPLPTGEFVYVGNGAAKVKLTSWQPYTLEIDYTASPAKTRLLDQAGTEVLRDFPTVEILTRLSSDPKNPLTSFSFGGAGETAGERKVLDHAFQLQVHHKKNPADPALGVYHLTTVSMIKAP